MLRLLPFPIAPAPRPPAPGPLYLHVIALLLPIVEQFLARQLLKLLDDLGKRTMAAITLRRGRPGAARSSFTFLRSSEERRQMPACCRTWLHRALAGNAGDSGTARVPAPSGRQPGYVLKMLRRWDPRREECFDWPNRTSRLRKSLASGRCYSRVQSQRSNPHYANDAIQQKTDRPEHEGQDQTGYHQ
jgi:hypothetical protein